MNTESPCDLESVIATGRLKQRPNRAPDLDGETQALLEMVHDVAKAPKTFFDKLITEVLENTHADSSGISLLDEEKGRFFWPAVVGGLASYIGGGTPADFGPCGTVLERDAPVLFIHPERHFTYLQSISPPLEEVLLIPFHSDGKPVGTIWAVIHEKDRHFDAEDKRRLENLSSFAASAYQVLVSTGALKAVLAGNTVNL
ncbi:GAF domain-containing protein [Luteolibacter soli]|uniref:GAF domain-containing protein n=1 Tax=Luteolibacter soli TaxID=3135280 RepID=A0ABU9B3G8_9BACT